MTRKEEILIDIKIAEQEIVDTKARIRDFAELSDHYECKWWEERKALRRKIKNLDEFKRKNKEILQNNK